MEPGEALRLEITVTVTPSIGSTITWTPPPGSGTGVLAAFASLCGNGLYGSGGAEGTWSDLGRAPGWALGGAGQPFLNGTQVQGIDAGQFILPGMIANSQNPIPAIWHGVWTPSSFQPRTVSFTTGPGAPPCQIGSAWILADTGIDPNTGTPIYVSLPVPLIGGAGQITVVPSLGTATALGAIGLLSVGRRSRRGEAASRG